MHHFLLLLNQILRIGHLEEAVRDLSIAVETSVEDDVKANLCQKLVSFKFLSHSQGN